MSVSGDHMYNRSHERVAVYNFTSWLSHSKFFHKFFFFFWSEAKLEREYFILMPILRRQKDRGSKIKLAFLELTRGPHYFGQLRERNPKQTIFGTTVETPIDS